MTRKQYFEEHIPHRINLLLTFRERFCEKSPFYIKPEISEKYFRDFYRCSMDISMLMIRFLLGELGINFKKKNQNPNNDISENWKSKFGIQQLKDTDVKNDKRYDHILEVLKAANRAVAHIEPKDVYHPVKDCILISAIDFTEEKIKSNMYAAAGFDYFQIMLIDNNNMFRKGIKIVDGK